MVEHALDLLQAHADLAVQVEDDRRVGVAGARAHHEAAHRAEAQAGVDRASSVDRGDAGAVAQVADDQS